MFVPLAVALGFGFFVSRRRGWIALAGIPVALALWATALLSGAFDDDTEGTAALLSLVYVVPAYAAAWALAVGAGYVVWQLWRKTRWVGERGKSPQRQARG